MIWVHKDGEEVNDYPLQNSHRCPCNTYYLTFFLQQSMRIKLKFFLKQTIYIRSFAHCMSSTAIYGYSFCKGAQRAFTLLVSNALRVGAINSVGAFVLLLGKLAVTAIVVIIGLEIFKVTYQLIYNSCNVTIMLRVTFGLLKGVVGVHSVML